MKAARPRKILYLSCHEILEFDDLRMFTDSGHRVFSLGSYIDPSTEGQGFRPALPQFYDAEFWETYLELGGDPVNRTLPQDFAKHFDVAIINHFPALLTNNSNALGDIPIVMRTVGQSRRTDERQYAELSGRIHVVRYTEREAEIPGFARTSDVIYFSKYPADFKPWIGGEPGVTFHNGYARRISYPDLPQWRQFSQIAGSRLYGNWLDEIPEASGRVSYEEMLGLYQKASFYFFVYTHPPSYTLSFIEAMMAGCPIMAPSSSFVASTATTLTEDDAWSPRRYEIESLLSNAAGVVYDTLSEAIYAGRWLTHDRGVAREISNTAATKARSFFDVEVNAPKWNALFDMIC